MDAIAPSTEPRRRFLKTVGGGIVLAATATAGGCSTGLPTEANAAWREAGAEPDVRRFMLAHALLAPNPHNRQPWIADLSVPDRITLVCDGDRLLPATDPYGRQILVGCGAFLELAVIAASQRGVAVELQPFPAGVPRGDALPAGTAVATLRLGPPGSAVPDPLFPQVLRRRTNKNAYENDRPLPAGLVERWRAVASAAGLQSGVVVDAPARGAIRRIAREAYEIECLTPRTWLESARLLRIGPQAIATHRDGISLNGAMPRLMYALGVFDPMEVPRRGSSSLQRVMDRWEPFETGTGYLWLASAGNDRTTQVRAGRAYVRLQLEATAAGVDMHPLSQALQEFAEMRASFEGVHRAIGLDPAAHTLQMLTRVGYAVTPAEPSPRRGLSDLVRA